MIPVRVAPRLLPERLSYGIRMYTSKIGAVAYPVRVTAFDICKVKWLPHPERLLSALVPMPQVATRDQGCHSQRVKACRASDFGQLESSLSLTGAQSDVVSSSTIAC